MEDHKECTVIKRKLKRAKAFEIRKLIRKIKLYSTKKGSDKQLESYKRKQARLVEEMEAIKDINLGDIAQSIINNGDTMIQEYSSMRQPPSDPIDRAKWRLILSKHIQQLSVTVHTPQEKLPPTHPCTTVIDHEEEGINNANDSCSNDESIISNNSTVTDGNDCSVEEQDVSHCVGVVSCRSASNERGRTEMSPCSAKDNHRGKGGPIERGVSDQKRVKLSSRRTKLQQIGHGRRNGKEMMSLFVGSLSSSNDSSMVNKGFRTNKAKNRMGQRARRKIWEAKFKEKAKHLKEQSNSKTKKGMDEDKKTRITIANKKKLDYRDRSSTAKDQQPATLVTAAPLHPSWEASRLRKQQLSIDSQTFQGSKIVFSDSD